VHILHSFLFFGDIHRNSQREKGGPGENREQSAIIISDRVRGAMPTFQREEVAQATVKLKSAQTRLTHLRRRHLEGDFISKTVFESFVLALAHHLRTELLALPAMIRRAVQETDIKDRWALEDLIEKTVDSWMLAYSTRPIPSLPKPERSKGAYTSKPGPKPRKPKIELEAAV
jgi:hypothetical protein